MFSPPFVTFATAVCFAREMWRNILPPSPPLCDVCYSGVFYQGDVAQHRKHHKAGKDAGQTVDDRYHQSFPMNEEVLIINE